MDSVPKDALYLARWEAELAVREEKLKHRKKCQELMDREERLRKDEKALDDRSTDPVLVLPRDIDLRRSRASATVTSPSPVEKPVPTPDTDLRSASASATVASSARRERSSSLVDSPRSRGGMSSSVGGFRSRVSESSVHSDSTGGRSARVVGSSLVVSMDLHNPHSRGGMSSSAEGSHLGVASSARRPREPSGVMSSSPGSARSPSPKRAAHSCDFCGPVKNMNIHLDNKHVPWFVSPERVCFRCREDCVTIPRVLKRHPHQDCVLLHDVGYQLWAGWMMGALQKVVAYFNVGNLDGLLSKVCRDGLYPPSHSSQPTPRTVIAMQAWAQCSGHTVCTEYRLSPPSDVACLVSRPVVRKWVMILPLRLQEEIKSPETLSLQDLRVPVEPPLVLFDSHIHCDQVLARSRFSTWEQVLQPAVNSRMRLETVVYSCNFPMYWGKAERISEHPQVFLSVGLHPHVVSDSVSQATRDREESLLQHPKCLAVGEVGLDYYHHTTSEEQRSQRQYLHDRLRELYGKPLVIHCRGHYSAPRQAREDLLYVLSRHVGSAQPLLIHSFSGDEDDVQAWLRAFPKAHFGLGKKCPPASVVGLLPVDQLVLESDAPYQCRGPADLVDVCQDVAARLNLPPLCLAQLTLNNARRFFRL